MVLHRSLCTFLSLSPRLYLSGSVRKPEWRPKDIAPDPVKLPGDHTHDHAETAKDTVADSPRPQRTRQKTMLTLVKQLVTPDNEPSGPCRAPKGSRAAQKTTAAFAPTSMSLFVSVLVRQQRRHRNVTSGFVAPEGTWCSGITSASHAEGPGFNPQRVHFRAQRGRRDAKDTRLAADRALQMLPQHTPGQDRTGDLQRVRLTSSPLDHRCVQRQCV